MHNLSIRRAAPAEYESVRAFYYQLIDDMAGLPYHPKWQKGIYPEDSYLASSMQSGHLHIALDDTGILAAMIVNSSANDGYAEVSWPTDAKTCEVSVIHALGVAVRAMQHGVGKAMVRYALELAEEMGHRAVRLDVIDGNLPAAKLYTAMGFGFVTRLEMYYEDTGWCSFDLYEYPLQGRKENMRYRYETHMHTRQGSACSTSSGAEMARAHKDAGYTGIFVTDHFFNGNCAVSAALSWEERVNIFCSGYEDAKREGDRIGLQVFFGFEFNYEGTEFLVYNLSKQWLLDHEDIDRMAPRKAIALMHADGGFVVQAHPFRERGYIDHFQLFPRDIDGVEAVNAAHKGEEGAQMNVRAHAYAKMFDLPVTSGSDSHHTFELNGGGIESPVRIEKPTDYLDLMRSGELTLLG